MAAGVMRDARSPELIETAGIELDRTLLAYDYLNGEPLTVLEGEVPDPLGPSGAAAAFGREAFLEAGGFDERIFAYLEDVDLVLRLRRDGGRCRLARDAQGVHEHSATLGAGIRAQGLPGRVRSRLSASQVERDLAGAAAGSAGSRGRAGHGPGRRGSQPRADPRPGPGASRGQARRALSAAAGARRPALAGERGAPAMAQAREAPARERLSDRGRQLHRDPDVDEPVQDGERCGA